MRASGLADDELAINAIVACEIEYGLTKRNSTRLRDQIEAILAAIPVLDFPPTLAEHYGQIRVDLEGRGTPIGPNDLIIAAHAAAAELTLVTNNEKEFRRVRNLKVENWL